MKSRILLIGPQGSGKSTQAELLAKYLNLPKISTGDIFRSLAQQDSPEAQVIKQILSSGNLIDDKTTARLVEQRLKDSDAKNGFILDGYPRNIQQKDLFDPQFDKVIYLKVLDEEVIRRLMVRGRADDMPDVIKTRLNLYYQQTQPLLDYYRNQGILTEVDGIGNVTEIQNEIRKNLEKTLI